MEISNFTTSHDDKIQDAIISILKELSKAERKHPNWPKDVIHQAAVVAEESGELTRASLQFVYEDGEIQNLRTEAIQTAAMAIRFLINLP